MATKSREFTLKQKGITPEKTQELEQIYRRERKSMLRWRRILNQNKFNLISRFYNLSWNKETCCNITDFIKKYEGKKLPSGKIITVEMIEEYLYNKHRITEQQIMKLKLCDGYVFPVIGKKSL